MFQLDNSSISENFFKKEIFDYLFTMVKIKVIEMNNCRSFLFEIFVSIHSHKTMLNIEIKFEIYLHIYIRDKCHLIIFIDIIYTFLIFYLLSMIC
jgi:hypothetical protein